jgi:hypothetical protein
VAATRRDLCTAGTQVSAVCSFACRKVVTRRDRALCIAAEVQYPTCIWALPTYDVAAAAKGAIVRSGA